MPAVKPLRALIRGAAMAEYIVIIAFGLIVAMSAVEEYGDEARKHIGEMARQIASNYYQGWFYPEGTPGLAAMGGESSRNGGGGPSDGGSHDGSSGDPGDSFSEGSTGGTFPGNDPNDPFNPGGNPGQACAVGGAGSGGIAGLSSVAQSPASTGNTFTAQGNPIDIGTGNKIQTESDYRQVGETPLVFYRYYNSHQTGVVKSLGPGWRHSYQRQLIAKLPNGKVSESAEDIKQAKTLKMLRDDGSLYLFKKQGEHWLAEGVVDQLEQTDNGWLYTTVNQTREYYSEAGQLLAVHYLNGVKHQLSYDEEHRLTAISDSRGARIDLHYRRGWLSRVELPSDEVLRFKYSEAANLAAFHRSRGGSWQQLFSNWTRHAAVYHYEDQRFPHALTGLTDAEGRRYATWGYDALGRANLSEHGEGVERLRFEYQDDETVLMTSAAGLVTTFKLEPARPGYRRLVQRDGHATPSCPAMSNEHRYNAQGFLRLAIDPENKATRFERNRRGQITVEERGLLKQAGQWQPVEGAQRIEQHWHPSLPLVTRATYSGYRNGQWQSYLQREWQYSDAGRLLARTETDLTQHSEHYSTQVEQRRWNYHYTFTADSLQPSEIQINGPREPLADGSDDIYHYHYNAQGRLQASINPLGQRTDITAYNQQGQPTAARLANGLQVALRYGGRGELEALELSAEGLKETYQLSHDRNGLLKQLTLPDGRWQQLTYNDARQLIEVSNSWGETLVLSPSEVSGAWTEQMVYSREGQITRRQQRSLDSLGRVVRLIGQQGQETTLTYSPSGNLETLQELGVAPHRQQYDSLNRLTQTLDALQGETTLHYNPQGRIASVTDAEGEVTGYRYNGFGEVISEVSAARGQRLLRRDEAGNVVAITSQQGQAEVIKTYDILNRPLRIDYPDGEQVHYQYDKQNQNDQQTEKQNYGIGQLTQLKDSSGINDYQYDALGRLVAEHRRQVIPKLQKAKKTTTKEPTSTTLTPVESLRYTYRPGGQLESQQFPNGARVHYLYKDQRLHKLVYHSAEGQQQTLISEIEHEAFGGPIAWQTGNQLRYQQSRDLDGRITKIQLVDKQQQTHWSQQYHYNHRNDITDIQVEGQQRSWSTNYDYDALHRLTQEQKTEETITRYSYDRVGNRLQRQQGNKTDQYHYGAGHQLLAIGEQRIKRDAQGNAISRDLKQGQEHFLYGRYNQPVAYFKDQQLQALYLYNSNRQRVAKYKAKSYERFRYSSLGLLLSKKQFNIFGGDNGELQLLPSGTTHYIYLGQTPIARIKETEKSVQISYLHTDHLNTPRLATDAQQRTVWQWQSDAFGSNSANEDPDQDGQLTNINLRFPGQYYDEESGLHYNFHRTYDPEIGRYTQSDPIGLDGGLNTFAYVNQNPVHFIDPYGLYLFAFDGTGNDRDQQGGGLIVADSPTNVAIFSDYYRGGDRNEQLYQPGVGTGCSADQVVGGLSGAGSRSRINEALFRLDELLKDPNWDGVIDIVGFSRGSAAAREFANEVYARIDNNEFSPTDAGRINIRFMGLFDTVASMGVAGNGTDLGYDLSTDPRIGHVAHAVAMNEHRWLFPLQSVSPVAGADISSGHNFVEQGFIGAHADIGGGYSDSDLSDIALQWMWSQANSVGVELDPLREEHKDVTSPVIHDERRGGFMGPLVPNNGDRAIYYPNDPFETNGRECERRSKGRCVQWEPLDPAERQSQAPQFPNLDSMIRENYKDNVRGEVDIEAYREWLISQGILQ